MRNIGPKRLEGTGHNEDPVEMLSKSKDDGDFLGRANKYGAGSKIHKEIHSRDNELNIARRK